MQAIVLADGDVASRAAIDAAWPGWAEPAALVVAADGGARHAGPLGLRIDRWVGDGDSLGEAELAALRPPASRSSARRPDKDESDTELAVLAALDGGARPASSILGALGGPRVDHALANVGLLAHARARRLDVRLLEAGAARPAAARPGRRRRRPSRTLRPVGSATSSPCCRSAPSVEGVTTDGLAYPLGDEPLLAGPDARALELAAIDAAGRRSGAADSSSSRPLLRSRHEHADRRRPRAPSRPAR